MKQIFITIAAILGASSVAAGAFGTHSLRGQLSERALEIFEVGTRYQMYHALALLGVAILLTNSPEPNKTLVVSGWLFITGILLFSGSLYALSLTNTFSLGILTPLGGAAFIAGWITLAFYRVGSKGSQG
ncbi:hypothetical protein NIES4071_50290 [Calothrix sp. NIES-4071]|nr:hypothetical protein NIES4071_50290 [Calothrix sp. NIES-4071]BAZ59336.1 hypothetical protein NIES4105_50230 [Calothrix sp. NIES-4105]